MGEVMNSISDQQEVRIRQWAETVGETLTLRYTTSGHVQDQPFRSFVDQLAGIAGCIRPKKESDLPVERPTLFVGPHVAYQALPLDRELEPFLAVLANGAAFTDQIGPDVRAQLERLGVPALLKVYVTPHCPFCPATVTTLLGLAGLNENVWVTVIDGMLYSEAADQDRISSAPTVILDDQFRWTGSVDALELVTLMLDRDPAGLSADALRGMIEDADADGVARLMSDHNQIFPAFIELLIHPRWSVRLGAMVVIETLVEMAPALAGQVVEPLLAAFATIDDTVKGDVLHVLGEAGNRDALPFLSRVLEVETDEEICDAASEAIEKLT
ncbi:hypothetical protein DSCO28_11980 [Desulfosarcina ovata subsp. sediminis]|uniref:Thioredoxin-like fold domain-containing protein n=2 Tax=Desulfosarcina ovata TaxID=83564 RepID=A0A5K7ZEZ9_9BACT|nr:hypothetical protein DSCO28_11980 [Desulfosarcina ovata subsp. sediminis]